MNPFDLAMQSLFQPTPLKTYLFPPTSRYYDLDTAQMETADGRTVIYLRRRFVPPPERFATVQEHVVAYGDRLDNLAAEYLGDPEVFWRICDANRALYVNDLTAEVGRHLRITLPEGVPGAANA